MKRVPATVLTAGTAAAAMAAIQSLGAQTLKPGQTVRDRRDPFTEAKGVRLGSFTLEPSIYAQSTYDDNIRATSTDPKTDVVTQIRPAVTVRSDWSRHALNARAGARIVRHARTPRENRVDADLNLNGHLDLGPATDVNATLHGARDHEDRSDPEAPGGAEPSPVYRTTADLTASHRFPGLTLSVSGHYARRDFADVAAPGGGVIDNDARDRATWRVGLDGTYRIAPGLKTFVKGRYGQTDFAGGGGRDGLDRDARHMEILTGNKFTIAPLTFGEVFAGLAHREHADPRLGGTFGLVSGMSLTSTITPLITLKAQVDRTLRLTTVRRTAAVRASAVRLSYDHEVLRPLMVGLDASYTRNSFVGIPRVDTLWTARLRADYRLSGRVRLTLRYAYSRRDSSGDAAFRRNRVALGVAFRY